MDEGHEADGSFGVTGGDGAVVFEFAEESFDAVFVSALMMVESTIRSRRSGATVAASAICAERP